MEWTFDHILTATNGRLLYGGLRGSVAGIGIDSRTIAMGSLFVALRGDRYDGHRFIPAALTKGIRGVLIDEAARDAIDHDALRASELVCIVVPDTLKALGALAHFQRRQAQIPVVAITGSNGKTTTLQLTAAVMATCFNTLATRGNLNNEIGLPLTLFQLTAAHQAAVLELGMNHAGEIRRLGAICQPTIGVITNVGPAHLEFLGSLEGVAGAKAELIDEVAPGGTLVLNADDPWVVAMGKMAENRRVIFFGTDSRAQVRAAGIQDTATGQIFTLILPEQTTQVELRAKGQFMVANALAAAGVGLGLGIDIQNIKAGLEAFRQTKGRLAISRTKKGIGIIDDTYNANPASMRAAIETLVALKIDQPGIIVVGDMLELGQHAQGMHEQLGRQAAASGAAGLYACGEHAGDVARGAQMAGMDPALIFTGAKEWITRELIHTLQPGSWVLVKGSRGMAMETVTQAISEALGG